MRHHGRARGLAPLRSACMLIFVSFTCFGCGRSETLNTQYGSRRGYGLTSINGTIVLGELFAQAGHHVSSWSRLSPKLNSEDVIVWTPDRYAPPTEDEQEFLMQWLTAMPGRTLIYVGRDYDAELDYWNNVLRGTTQPQSRLTARLRRAEAKAQAATSFRPGERQSIQCDWFELTQRGSAPSIGQLKGPWSAGVDDDACRISVTRRLKVKGVQLDTPPASAPETTSDSFASPDAATRASDDGTPERLVLPASDASQPGQLEPDRDNHGATPLLWSESGELLAAKLSRPDWATSQLIVINNGSWLLNYPLIRRGHRQLAAHLVASIPSKSDVCFLECGDSEMSISDSDVNVPLALQVFSVFPINLLVTHLAALGIIYCCCVFPIFGRPKRLPREHVSDFGKHITAVGEMLERGQHRDYAVQQIQHYDELIHSARQRVS